MTHVRVHRLPGSQSVGRRRLHSGPLVLGFLLLVALVVLLWLYVAAGSAPPLVEPAVRAAPAAQAPVPAGASGPGLGAAYDRAVARLVAANQRLEERQTALALAELAGSDAATIAALRKDVAVLERVYVSSVRAMATVRAER